MIHLLKMVVIGFVKIAGELIGVMMDFLILNMGVCSLVVLLHGLITIQKVMIGRLLQMQAGSTKEKLVRR